MIKLIASDIDGTIVKESSDTAYPELYETIEALIEKGIIFFAASGRQYASIHNLFGDIADKIGYIAENGAYIRYGGRDLQITSMKREYVEGIVRELRRYSDTCELLVSTAEYSMVESKNQDFLDLMEHAYHNKFKQVDDVLAEDVPVVKISIYHEAGIRELGESVLIPHWKDKVKAVMAGEEWVDFMDASVDKGHALAYIREYLQIAKEETMAFGDNENDIGLMKAAGESYAVENAREPVKAAADYICPDYTKKGVYHILKTLL